MMLASAINRNTKAEILIVDDSNFNVFSLQ
jgi:CheY-like chemotaxis protein